MPRRRKKKKKPFRVVPAVKALARERIGAVPPAQVVGGRKSEPRAKKHKPTLADLVEEDE